MTEYWKIIVFEPTFGSSTNGLVETRNNIICEFKDTSDNYTNYIWDRPEEL